MIRPRSFFPTAIDAFRPSDTILQPGPTPWRWSSGMRRTFPFRNPTTSARSVSQAPPFAKMLHISPTELAGPWPSTIRPMISLTVPFTLIGLSWSRMRL